MLSGWEIRDMAGEIRALCHAPGDLAEANRLRNRLAREFGERYGWTMPRRHPAPDFEHRLCGVRYPRKSGVPEPIQPAVCDHPYYYLYQRKPVAIACHIYSYDLYHEKRACEWAEKYGLDLWTPTNFPSWWYPGETKLIVYMRKGAMRP